MNAKRKLLKKESIGSDVECLLREIKNYEDYVKDVISSRQSAGSEQKKMLEMFESSVLHFRYKCGKNNENLNRMTEEEIKFFRLQVIQMWRYAHLWHKNT